MAFQPRFTDQTPWDKPLGKIVCVGRNYADHAKELNNPVPTEPLLFMKPATSASHMADGVVLPADLGDVHYETEMAVLIGQALTKASVEEAAKAIVGVGAALDLTLRDLQSRLKEKGHPWERAKGFDGSCPLSDFVPAQVVSDLQDVQIKLTINGDVRQDGNTEMMLYKVVDLLSHISQWCTLEAGDVVITGTPAGVGKLNQGDQLSVELGGLIQVTTEVR
jgi:2-keto-4-pentenoate hydratase/2-oxohepta-3-ene-1,7-dioic acid hydratase in catechol pathway